MSNLWDRFDGIASVGEVEEAKAKYAPIEAGTYKMTLEKIEASESREGLPMVKGQFRTAENKVVFYNQMLQNLNYPQMTAVNVAEAVTFVSGLLGREVQFAGLSKLATLISEIPTGDIHTINVSYGKKDTEMKYPKLKVIAQNLDLEGGDDLPFDK